jgi:hypothetical protein
MLDVRKFLLWRPRFLPLFAAPLLCDLCVLLRLFLPVPVFPRLPPLLNSSSAPLHLLPFALIPAAVPRPCTESLLADRFFHLGLPDLKSGQLQ